MARKKVFNAGPCVLPLEVLEELQADMVDYQGTGMSMLEASHRSRMFSEMYEKCLSLIREVYHVPENFDVFFLGGGGTLEFALAPLNFLKEGGHADYIKSGYWSGKACQDAEKIGKVSYYFDGTESGFTTLPDPAKVKPSEGSSYMYLCANETIGGIEWQSFPDFKEDVPLIADMSSDYFTRPVPLERFGMVFGGVQKNLGPAGATLVILRKDMEERQRKNLPAYFDLALHAKKNGLYNTPPVFNIWAVKLMMQWIKDHGGVEQMEKNAIARSSLVYEVIDSSEFWRCPVDRKVRSRTNIVFRLPSEELEAEFVKESEAAGMVGLKGHRSVGGLRASLFNACPLADAEDLCAFMRDFERRKG